MRENIVGADPQQTVHFSRLSALEFVHEVDTIQNLRQVGSWTCGSPSGQRIVPKAVSLD